MLKLVFGALMISFSAVFVKLVDVGPTVSAFYRMLLGGGALALVVLYRRESFWFGKRAMIAASVAAIFFTLDLVFWHRSILYVGPGLSTLLANFQVFILALAGWLLFSEHMSKQAMLAIPLAMIGLGLLVLPEWENLGADYHLGVWFGLLTAVCYAGYLITLRKTHLSDAAPSHYSNMAILSLICAAMLALVLVAEGESFLLPGWTDFSWLLTYGIVAQLIGWVLISKAIIEVRATQVGLILLLQPTFAFVWDVLFFSRQLTVYEIAGAVLALVAIYLGGIRRTEAIAN
ncbi:MAG: DMT family transporter [Gammaproteobacteria bacterium]